MLEYCMKKRVVYRHSALASRFTPKFLEYGHMFQNEKGNKLIKSLRIKECHAKLAEHKNTIPSEIKKQYIFGQRRIFL